MKPDETNVVAPSSRLIAALLGHAGSWYMHSSPKRNRRAEGLSIKIKWITHYQLTYCNILRQVQTDDAMVCCISTLCMALRSSAQGPRGLNYGMGSFAIAGHGMPNFLVRRRSEYCLMPRHVFFCFFGKKSEAHKCCRDAICLNTPKIAWQGSTPEIFNVFAPGIAGLHLGEDWECCQRLQRRNSAEGLTEKLVPLEVKSAAPESVTQKLPTNEVKKFRSSLIPKRFTSHSCIKRRCCWSDHELARWMKLKEDDLCTFPGFVPPPEAQEASRQKSIAHVHLSQKDGWQDCEGSKAQTSCKKWLSRLSISIPSSDINITRLELLSFPSNNSKADSSVLFQHISTFNQPRTHFRGVWTLNWRCIRIISATSLPEWLCASCESGLQRKTALRYVNKHKKHLKQQDCLLSLDFHSVHFFNLYIFIRCPKTVDPQSSQYCSSWMGKPTVCQQFGVSSLFYWLVNRGSHNGFWSSPIYIN